MARLEFPLSEFPKDQVSAIQRTIAAAPYPMDARVYADGRPGTVVGYRKTDDGYVYSVAVDGGNGTVVVSHANKLTTAAPPAPAPRARKPKATDQGGGA